MVASQDLNLNARTIPMPASLQANLASLVGQLSRQPNTPPSAVLQTNIPNAVPNMNGLTPMVHSN